jgi:hypothetical protein
VFQSSWQWKPVSIRIKCIRMGIEPSCSKGERRRCAGLGNINSNFATPHVAQILDFLPADTVIYLRNSLTVDKVYHRFMSV